MRASTLRVLPLLAAPLLIVSTLPAEEPALESDNDKILYTLGLALSHNIASFEFNEAEFALIHAGLRDGVLGKDPRVEPTEWASKIDPMLQSRMTLVMEREKEQGAEFTTKAAAEAGAETLTSGMVYRELSPGDGASPAATDTVKIHYHGTLRDGAVFDSSAEKEPVTFALNAVIPCFSEGVQKMKIGGKSKLTCPPDTAYGERGSPPKILPGATIQFEVQLMEIVPAAGQGGTP